MTRVTTVRRKSHLNRYLICIVNPRVPDEKLEAEKAQRKLEREKRRIEFEKGRAARQERREEFYRTYPTQRRPVEKYGTIQR